MFRWVPSAAVVALAATLVAVVTTIVPLAAAGLQLPPTRPGVDVLLETPGLLQGSRIGLVTHAAGITSAGHPTSSVLQGDPRFTVSALFAPEHGLGGTLPAGQPVPDAAGRIPTFSLYGSTRRPTAEMLAHVDVFVIDLQDVGARAYTYVSTMAMVMDAAAAAGKPVVVLDRPNPQGGVQVDGPVLDPAFRSFIGMFPIPSVHGLTIGELAQLFNEQFQIGAHVTVVPMQGWTRRMVWEGTGLPWVRPSPNIPTMMTPFYFATTGLLDGTNLSAGVGTAHPFEFVASPWLDGERLAARLTAAGLPGVAFEPSEFTRGGTLYRGVRLVVTDPLRYRPATTAVYILAEVRRLPGSRLEFIPRAGRQIFDLGWGTDTVRDAIVRGAPASAIVGRWEPDLRQFQALRSAYLLYP